MLLLNTIQKLNTIVPSETIRDTYSYTLAFNKTLISFHSLEGT
jgi:hypothetical protein